MLRSGILALFCLSLLALACSDSGGGSKTTPVTSIPSTAAAPTATQPEVSIPNTAPSTAITLPSGFSAYALATDFLRPTSIALAPNGDVYVSERHDNIYRMVDADGDGVFESRAVFASGFDELTGLFVAPDGTVYASSRGKVTTLRDTDGDGAADQQQDVITGLPVGRHQNDGLLFGPDGKLYVTLGSTCDDCVEADPQSATILQANPDGSALRVYATGLRNPYDIVFDNQGRLWSTDNGSDAPCATIDEVDFIVDGGDYGWPYGGDAGCDPTRDGRPPVADLGLHTASTGITQYNATQFPAEYDANLFLTLWGSLINAPEPVSQVLMRVVINDDAFPAAGEVPGPSVTTTSVFGSGFMHPIDVLVDQDGTLLVLDYGSENEGGGVLYRIIYTGG